MASTFKRSTSRGVGTTLTAVGSYVVPPSTQTTVIGLSLCNTTGSAVTVDCTHNDGANDTYLVKGATVPAGTALVIIGGDQKQVLMVGDTIKVKSSVATSVDVVMSYLEIA